MRTLIVVGSGIAGLFTALRAREAGVRDVLIVTKADLEESATRYAQGGIAAAIGDGDSWALHQTDTLGAGADLCDPEAVRVLTSEAADRVADLIRLGVHFDTENGGLAHAREGAHTVARVLHAGGDATGRHIERALARAVRQRGIDVYDRALITELIVEGGACRGVRLAGGDALEAEAVVLAAGGAGQLYARTTNPSISTGDGVALALRAGAVVADLEFFQFHPTAFAGPGASRFLISEALRGHGAVLRNHRGEAFMARYDVRAELASRDIVARSIVQEMERHGLGHVWLDATHFAAGELARRFPTIHAYCASHGCQAEREPIPVSPAAHYMMGGVWTDLWGRTSVDRVARALTARAVGTPAPSDVEELAPDGSVNALLPARDAIRAMMWDEVGILREGAGLERVRAILGAWSRARPLDDGVARETGNLALLGWVMAEAARRRQESRGAHYRLDFPEPRPEWRHRQLFTVRCRRELRLAADVGATPVDCQVPS